MGQLLIAQREVDALAEVLWHCLVHYGSCNPNHAHGQPASLDNLEGRERKLIRVLRIAINGKHRKVQFVHDTPEMVWPVSELPMSSHAVKSQRIQYRHQCFALAA